MAGERGSVEIDSVRVGHRIELVKYGDIYHDNSGILGVVTGKSEEGIQVRLTSPRSLTGNAHLRLTFKEQSARVFDWGRPVTYKGGINYLPGRLPRVGGNILPGIKP